MLLGKQPTAIYRLKQFQMYMNDKEDLVFDEPMTLGPPIDSVIQHSNVYFTREVDDYAASFAVWWNINGFHNYSA